MFVKTYHRLDFMEMNDPNQLCRHRDGKSCDFRKTFIENFCGESVFISYLDLQLCEKIALFCFFETNGPNHLFRPLRDQNI